MKAKDFLARITKERNNTLFSALRYKRAIDLRARKESHSWEGQNYKIYPSSLSSITMCPKKFVEEDVHKPPSFHLDSYYKMELGKTIHTFLQDESVSFDIELLKELSEDMASDYLESVDFYVRKMYKQEASQVTSQSLLYGRPRNLGPELEKKLEKAWPEIPGYDEESGFSFRCDLVLNIDGEPGIIDIKTTSIPSDNWVSQLSRFESKYTLQVRIYRYFFNKHNYFDKPVRHVGLGYVNLLMPTGAEGSEYEVWEDMGTELDKDLENLITHLTVQRNSYIKTRSGVPCEYDKCREHRKHV